MTTDTITRSKLQRELGASFDFWHALLVRAVHPLAFGAFVLAVTVVGGVIGAIAVEIADLDVVGIGFTIIVMLIAAVIAAFSFVFTITRGIATIVLVTIGGIATIVVDDIDRGVLWAIWSIAAASVALQVVLLAWVGPRRVRAGLTHLLGPATIGTAIGAIPVVAGIAALLDGRDTAALRIAQVAILATVAATGALLAMYLVIRRGDDAIGNEFAARHDTVPQPATDEDTAGAALTSPLVATWSRVHRRVTIALPRGRRAGLTTGYTSSRSPDVPCLHLTVLALAPEAKEPDLWIRRRSLRHDNLLVNTAHTPVVRFESIALDEDWTFRFAPGTTQLDAYEQVGPQVLELLGRSLGDAQVCRTGGGWFAWIVGGAVSADELDVLLELLVELEYLLG